MNFWQDLTKLQEDFELRLEQYPMEQEYNYSNHRAASGWDTHVLFYDSQLKLLLVGHSILLVFYESLTL